jgi:hypothetical protein
MTPTELQKRLVIVGATGMVGRYALRYALGHPAVGGATAAYENFWLQNLRYKDGTR